jgi:Rad3-related DNA helicase
MYPVPTSAAAPPQSPNTGRGGREDDTGADRPAHPPVSPLGGEDRSLTGGDRRVLCWFSAGAASAVATKLALAEYGPERCVVASIDPGSEHPDNERFLRECEEWFGVPIVRLKSEKYADTWQVFEERRFLVGPSGALCTAELKKKVRYAFERPDDHQVFGYTSEEQKRADRFREQNPGIDLLTPLIDSNLTKSDCLLILERAGIELPEMYRLGYRNNNCIGCVKGGMGYWNKIRVDFPDVYDRMAKLERHLGRTVLRDKDGAVWLDELEPTRGNYKAEIAEECGISCATAEETINTATPVAITSRQTTWADPRYTGWTLHDPEPFPAWVTQFRDTQLDAVDEILEQFEQHNIVFLDAPTGAGKTLIGEMVRRRVGGRAVYVCHGLGLQDQFARDFPYARLIKGRANYPTVTAPYPEVTCGDCTGSTCRWCPNQRNCPYQVARGEALGGKLAVTNTAYLLAEMIGRRSGLAGRKLMIVDEADTLEGILAGAVEFRVTAGLARRLGVTIPGKAVHKPTIAQWITDKFVPAVTQQRSRIHGNTVEQIRERARLTRLIERAVIAAAHIETGMWTREYRSGQLDLVLKPVKVDEFGPDRIWRHSNKWLLMSATIISPDEMADSLGITEPYATVRIPMRFPVEHRQIHAVPLTDMSYRNRDQAWPEMVRGIERVLELHPGERILVHTVSFALAEHLAEHVDTGQRPVYRYAGTKDREQVVAEFKTSDAGVLFAPSVDRGFDFAGDEARVVVVAKVPFPSLGDRVVSERMRTPGGEWWYQVQMVRTLVQMTGRGVRSETDWCHTYILDAAFYTNVLRKARRLLPAWWLEALNDKLTPPVFMGRTGRL